MNRFLKCALVLCFLLSMTTVAFSGGEVAFNEEKASVLKNGADTFGQVFRKADEPQKLLVLAGDVAFLVDVTAKTVHDAAINSVNDKSDPVMIDYGVLSEVTGAGLTGTGNRGFTFTAKGDRYEVTVQSRLLLDGG
jgi:hypothetical protein